MTFNRFGDYANRLKGRRGERQIAHLLRKLGYPTLNDCHVARSGERVTQIDHIVLVGDRIVVIETKNWLANVFARDEDENWTLVDDNGSEKTTIESPVKQNQVHVQALREKFGIEPLGLVVLTDLSTFKRDTPHGVVQARHLKDTLAAIAKRAMDDRGAKQAWERIEAYLEAPGSPTREDHQAYLAWLRVSARDTVTTRVSGNAPDAICRYCKSTDVRLGYGHSHYWHCLSCGKNTGIPAHAGDIARERDPVKAFAGRRETPPQRPATTIDADIDPTEPDVPGLKKLRWPPRRPTRPA